MKRKPAVALSIFLAPPLALALSFAAHGAQPQCRHESVVQPGRLETAREIKTQADEFVSKGRDLSQRLNAQIAEAQRLKSEALKLQILVAQQSTAPGNSPPGDAKPAVENKNAASETSQPGGDNKTTAETGADGKPADAGKTAPKEEKLSGRASQLQTVAPPNIPLIKLKGPQFQQALQQFNADVDSFKVHAAEYNKHMNMFRSQIGECQAAKNAFDNLHKKYEMHCDAYHLNNIPPPHLCLEMNVSSSEASSISNQLMNDQMRALRAEAQLNAEEGKLKQLEGMQGSADRLVVKASDRARREKEIAGMFGRLRQEYDLLEIERKTIDASRTANGKPSAPVVRPYVSGKIKKAK